MKNITDHIVSRKHFNAVSKAVLGSPSVISVFILVIFSIGILSVNLINFSFIQLLLLISVSFFGAIAWVMFYFLFGEFGWFWGRWNVPLSVSLILFSFLETGVLFFIFVLIFQNYIPLEYIVQEFLKVFFLTAIGTQIVIAFRTDDLRDALKVENRSFPIWTKLTESELDNLQTKPEIFYDDVIMIQSFNQYVVVTTPTDKADIRMSLKEAITFIDQDLGMRIHRSYWVKSSEIDSLSYKNGNPFVKMRNGDDVPVGRTMVPAVKNHIGQPL